MIEATAAAPKTFISYSWTTPAHEQWVIDFATYLRQSGVDVILDKWDLGDGHDKFAFMERMITDSEVQKVIIVADKLYAEKADGRKGGVGTETQIISTEIYQKAEQSKFLAVVTELDENGEPFLPTYFKSRIYRDLSTPEAYDANIEHVLRFIFGRPLNLKPKIGSPPSFLTAESQSLPASALIARRVSKAIETDSPKVTTYLAEYYDSLPALFERFRMGPPNGENDFEEFSKNIGAFLQHRDEIISTTARTVRAYTDDAVPLLHRLFEKLLPLTERPEGVSSWHSNQFDNFKFLVHELYLYTVATFLTLKKFKECASFISTDLFAPNFQNASDAMHPFGVLQQHCNTLGSESRTRGRLSLHADILKERASLRIVTFNDIMQADFVLYLRATWESLAAKRNTSWFPVTLLYSSFSTHQPFEIFARSQSLKFFNENVAPLIGVSGLDEFKSMLGQLSGDNRDYYVPRWQFNRLPVAALSNRDNLGSRP